MNKQISPLSARLGACASLGLLMLAACAAAPPAKADPAAWSLLKSAHDARQVFPAKFSGFSADLAFEENGKETVGTVSYRPGKAVDIQISGLSTDADDWLKDQVQSMLAHRQGGDFAQGEGKYPITFGAGGGNQWGRPIELHDGLKSSYRVRGEGANAEVTEVTRTMDGLRFTISVLESRPTDEGKSLPAHFIVGYHDAATGALQRVEGFRDSYKRFDGGTAGNVWLPSRRTVIFFDGSGDSPMLRVISIRQPKPLPAQQASAKTAR